MTTVVTRKELEESGINSLKLKDVGWGTISLTNVWGALLKDGLPLVWGNSSWSKIEVPYTMRMYLRTDWQWVSLFDDNYWGNTENATEYAWTWVNPVIEWENQGHIMKPWQQLTSIDILGRSNATDPIDIELSIWIKRPKGANSYVNWIDNDTEVGYQELFRWTFSELWWWWNIADRHYKEIPFTYTSNEVEELHIFIKATWVITTQRYFYPTFVINKTNP